MLRSTAYLYLPCCVGLLFTGRLLAAPVAVNDSYNATEDTVFVPTGPPLISGNFDTGADGFTYADNTFGTDASAANYETGSVQATRGVGGTGGLLVDVGRRPPQPRAASGAWGRSFTLTAAATVEVKFNYRLRTVNVESTTTFGNPFVRYGEVVFTMDGTRQGTGTGNSVLRLDAPFETGVTQDSDWQQATFNLALAAGSHAMLLGAYSNSTGNGQYIETLFDNVTVIAAGSGSVLVNDTGGVAPVTAVKVSNPANGSVLLASNGNFTYTPNANFNGTDSFTYRAADSSGNSNVATVTINVAAVNDVPAGGADSYTTPEDTPLTVPAPGVLANDTDVDNPQNTLTATNGTTPANGTLSGNADGSFTYTPKADYFGTDTFTYTVSDGTAQSAPVTVNVTVTPLPDPPVANPDSYRTSAGVPLAITVPAGGAGTPVTLIQAAPETANGGTAQPGDLWRYLDNGTDQGTAWREPLFNDSAWKSGRGELGYGDAAGENRPEFTVIEDNPTPGYTASDTNRYITHYFRKTFTVEDARRISGLQMSLLRDDGAVVFLNGNRIYFDTGLDGATYLTTTPGSVSNEATHIAVPLPDAAQYLTDGDNVLAVEIHQQSASTSDMSFDLGLTAVDRPLAGVLSNDTEPDGQTMTAQLLGNPTHGALTLNANGTFTYTPAGGYVGPDSFTYQASDGSLTSGTATVTVTVTPAVNQTPVALADSYNTAEDTALNISAAAGVLANDSDFEQAPMTAALITGPASGTLTLNADGSFGYTPAANFFGSVSFTYRASDGVKLSAPATVTINISSVPDVPVAVADSYRTIVGTALVVSATSPGSSAPLTLITAAPETPSGGPAQAGDLWRYLDNGSNQGTAWQAIDFNDSTWKEGRGELGYGDSSDNRPEFTIVEDNPVPGYSSASDRYITTYFRKAFAVADHNRLSAMSMSLLRDDGVVIWLNGNRIYAEGSLDTASLTYLTLADNTPNEATHDTISLPTGAGFLVDGMNVLAVEVHQNTSSSSDISFDLGLTVTESSYAGVLANDSDPEGNTFTASVAVGPAHGSLTLNPNGTFTYTPAAGFKGTDTFTYRATDATGPSAPATVSIIVSGGPNQKPAAVADSYTVTEDVLLSQPAPGVLANDTDPDNDILTAVQVTGPAHGALTLNADGSFTYLSAANYNGPDSFTYRVRDSGNLLSSVVTVNLTVNPANDAPVALPDSFATDPGVTLVVAAAQGVLANDFDPDGDTLTAQIISSPAAGSLTLSANGSFNYVPAAPGTYTFSYAASDGTAASPPATVTLIVNGRPSAGADSYTVVEDTPLTVSAANGVLANDTDPESSPLTAAAVTQPQHGSLTLAPDGGFTYAPAANYAGADSFTYTVFDGSRTSLPAAVSLTVTPVNDAPVAVADAYAVLKDFPLTVSAAAGVLKNDTDPDNAALTASLVTGTVNGSLTLNPDGSFTYTPPVGFTGSDGFTYRTSDGVLQSSVVTVTLTITAVSDTVVISEIMFNPLNGLASREYVELHNYGTLAVDVGGWRFSAGITFTFPATTILPAGGRLVLASDPAAFDAQWPGVTNRLATGWGAGFTLSNSAETIRLQRPDIARPGNWIEVDQVDYSDEGDWAVRQAESVGNNNGWKWTSGADGGGQSLQLRSHLLSNNRGQNWASATPTPGAANTAVAAADLAPFILNVKHSPPFPTPTQQVYINCDLEDEAATGQSATAWWRLAEASPAAFTAVTMFDDGLHNDGAPGDGKWGATLPAQAAGAIVEFYVEASDGTRSRTWPAPALSAAGATLSQASSANCFYQVDPETWTGNQPLYRLIMSRPEGDAFVATSYDKSEASDTDKNVTVIFAQGTDTSIRYQAGVRYRGAGSRSSYAPHNWKLSLPHDSQWNNWTSFNLNSLSAHTLVLGSRLMQAAGLPCEIGTAAAVRMNGSNRMVAGSPSSLAVYGLYSHQTPMGSEWAKEALASDPGGNIYKKVRGNSGGWPLLESSPGVPNVSGYISAGWVKQTNVTENQWTDLNDFIRTIRAATSNATTPPSFNYAAASTVADLDQWARWWAFCVIINHHETNLSNGVDDDYSIYIREADRKVMLLAHDFDTILSAGDSPIAPTATIWQAYDTSYLSEKTFAAAGLDIPRALFFNNHFARRFKYHLRDLLATVFAQPNFNAAVESALSVSTGTAPWVPQSERDRIRTFMDSRRTYILTQLPAAFTAVTSLPVTNGLPTTTTADNTGLTGTMDGALTDRVLVNGVPAVVNNHDNNWTAAGIAAGLSPGVNTVFVQAQDESGKVLASQSLTIFYDDGGVVAKSGTLAGSETWSASGGPWQVNSTVTVPAGVTLTIAPGASVHLAAGADISVTGGRLIAEGTPDRMIRFTRPPGTTGTWGGIVSDGATEVRVSNAVFEYNNKAAIQIQEGTPGTFDRITFLNNTRTCLQLDSSSFVVSNCTFPAMAAGQTFAVVGGSGNIAAGGQGLIRDCTFGAAQGNNDVIDFTGGNRPAPVLHVMNCVFEGSGDDVIDIDGTDAWIEGNVFMHVHKNGSPDSSSAVSGGSFAGQQSQVTMIRNLIYDCDNAVTMKQGNSCALLYNTIARITTAGGTETLSGVVNFADTTDGTQTGAGAVLIGNVIQDAASLTRQYYPATTLVTVTDNILPVAWSGPGSGNAVMLNAQLNLSLITAPATATAAQVRAALAPQACSPAVGSGHGGNNKGASFPAGIAASGVSITPTGLNSATLVMGPTGSFTGNSPWSFGWTHYRYSTSGTTWSADIPVSSPITFTGLANGPQTVYLLGRDDTGVWQTTPTVLTWTVNTALPTVVLSEVLAANVNAWPLGGTRPDLIELHNYGTAPLSLAGFGLTDDAALPFKYVFPAGTQIGPGGYLSVAADDLAPIAGELHCGFGLDSGGETLTLTRPGGTSVDAVTFGPQIADFSIARTGSRLTWSLATPTPGAANTAWCDFGSPSGLRINEWLAANDYIVEDDFIELYNPSAKPVNMSGMLLTDNFANLAALRASGDSSVHVISPLSFIRGNGFIEFLADGNQSAGGNHLSFKLSQFHESLGLAMPEGSIVDFAVVSSAREDVSEGRATDGGLGSVFFTVPTPGFTNTADLTTEIPLRSSLRITELMYNPESSAQPEFIEFRNIGAVPLDLTGVTFAAGVTFTFPAMSLASGAYAVITSDAAKFATAFPGVPVTGVYTGRLDNSGEQIRYELAGLPIGILDFQYKDSWFPLTDGDGASLQIVDATRLPGTWDERESWQAGAPSPGAATAFGILTGPDQRVTFPAAAVIDGTLFPGDFAPGAITVAWSKVSGPGTVSFTAPANPDTNASFSLPGTYELKVTAIAPGPVTVQDFITVTVEESYDAWAARLLAAYSPADRLRTADPDRDGLPNLAEYLFGTSPSVAASTGRPEPVISDGQLSLEYRRSSSADASILVVPEISADMVTWHSDPGSILHLLISESGGFQTWQARDPEPMTPGAKRYIRLRIIAP